MQTIRTTITLPKDLHRKLKREAIEKDKTLNDILVDKVTTNTGDDVRKRRNAFEEIVKLRKHIDTKGINYRELIEDGRKY